MTLKQYHTARLIVTVLIAMIIGQSFVLKNFLIPLATVTIGPLVLLALRRRVKEVITDERDYATGGKAALLAIQIFSWIGVIVMFALYTARDLNPSYEPMGMMIAFAVCLLMLLYSAIFRFYNHEIYSRKKILYAVLSGLLLAIVLIGGIRAVSGEDNWICQNGAWVKHGNPSFPAPTVECK